MLLKKKAIRTDKVKLLWTRSRTAHLGKSLMKGGKTHKDGKVVGDVLRSLKTEEEWSGHQCYLGEDRQQLIWHIRMERTSELEGRARWLSFQVLWDLGYENILATLYEWGVPSSENIQVSSTTKMFRGCAEDAKMQRILLTTAWWSSLGVIRRVGDWIRLQNVDHHGQRLERRFGWGDFW